MGRLARDNPALVRRLDLDITESRRLTAGTRNPELSAWIAAEIERLGNTAKLTDDSVLASVAADPQKFSQQLLNALWLSGDSATMESAYAPYAVMHRSPVEIVSGRTAIGEHYAALRAAFACSAASVDHIAVQSAGGNAVHVASRWAVCATHSGEYLGAAATGKPVFIMGVTHRRIIDGRIAVEWTVFDSLGVLSQLL